MDKMAPSVSKREFFIFLYKYRLRLILAFLIPLLVAVGLSFLPTPRYTASSVLVVRLGSEYVYQPETGNSGNGPANIIPFSQEQIFKSEVAILSSDDLHEQVIKEIGVENLYPNLIQPSGTGAFIASIEKPITDKLKELTKTPEVQLSKEELDHQRLAQAVEIFDKRFSILLEKESAVINISFEHKDSALAVRALDTLLRFYFEKRKNLYIEPRANLARKEAQSSRARVLAANRAADEYKRIHMIFSLPEQRAELLKRRSELQRQLAIIVNPELERQIMEINGQLDELDAKEHTYNNLKREAEVAEASYDNFARKYDEANSYDSLQNARADSVRIIQPPVTPAEPKSIQFLIVLGGLFLSVVIALLVAAITEFSRSGFLTPEHIERSLDLQVLAVVPYRRS